MTLYYENCGAAGSRATSEDGTEEVLDSSSIFHSRIHIYKVLVLVGVGHV